MIEVALLEPEIPQNTGNIARLCAATQTPLHVVGVTGFRLDERAVRRAGLDYWPEVSLQRHRDLDALYGLLPTARFIYFSTRAEKSFFEWKFDSHDCLVFGPETRGLPESLLRQNWEQSLTIPMLNPKVRSLGASSCFESASSSSGWFSFTVCLLLILINHRARGFPSAKSISDHRH